LSVAHLLLNAASSTAKFGMQLRTDHVQDMCWALCL